jgi:putative membrane protein
MKIQESNNEVKAIGFVIILYVVGVAGSAIPFTRELFMILTPVVLLLSFAILLWFHVPGFDNKTTIIFTIIFLSGFLVEVAGVKTGQIFGAYSYGKGLGPKLFDTPLMIGLNWVLLVYCTSAIFEKIPAGSLVKITMASLLMVLYDLVMEQVAPKMDMWGFDGGTAPLRNYISWFILALIFHSILRIAGIRITNRLAPLIFYCQGIFFIILFVIFKIAK